MATATLDDYDTIPTAEAVVEHHQQPTEPDNFESTAPSQNIGLAVLKRWPWLLVGVAGGLVLGLLYHTQQRPLYESRAQLFVIKNRPEMLSGPNASLTMVEDYVATQVTLLKSELILAIAAAKLQESQFE